MFTVMFAVPAVGIGWAMATGPLRVRALKRTRTGTFMVDLGAVGVAAAAAELDGRRDGGRSVAVVIWVGPVSWSVLSVQGSILKFTALRRLHQCSLGVFGFSADTQGFPPALGARRAPSGSLSDRQASLQ